MVVTAPRRSHSNLPLALAFAVAVVALFLMAPHTEPISARAPYVAVSLSIVLSPLALIWVVGEVHLRFSPRAPLPRAVVGWTLALACLGLCLALAPPALYVLLMSSAYAFGW